MREPSAEPTRLQLSRGGLRRASIVAVQFLLFVFALWALSRLVSHLSYVLIPLAVTILLAAMLEPMVAWLRRHRWPRSLAVIATLVVGVTAVGALVTFVVMSIVDNVDELRRSVSQSVAKVRDWLANGPLEFGGQLLERAQQWLQSNQQPLVSQAFGAFSTTLSVLAGLALAIVLLVMFLYDGPKMWRTMLRPWRPGTRTIVDEAGRDAFRSVVLYVRVTALIALLDAVGIGIGLAIVGVPLTIPLAALVFLGGFVPYVGAFVSGLMAIAVTLVSNGPAAALIILGVVVLVQQLEGQLFQPVLQGSFVHLHPALVLIVLTIGGVEGGIAGVLFAVPLTTAVRAGILAVARHRT